MTIKEKLYKEYIIRYNKVCELNGKEPLECNEEFFNSIRFQCEARTKSINEWRERICYQEDAYKREVMRLRIENYFNTEEGKILKENTKKRLNEIYDTRRKYIKETEKEIEQIIKSFEGMYVIEVENVALVKSMIDTGEITKEEGWDVLESLTNNVFTNEAFMSFLQELQELLGCKIVRGTLVIRDKDQLPEVTFTS